MKPWSYSSLSAFETCPRQYDLVRNKKLVKDAPGEAQLWGTWCHKQLEDRLGDSTPLPDALHHLEPLMAKIEAWPGQLLLEQQLAVGPDFEPAGWWESWARGIVDVAKVHQTKAVVLDYKTGKRKPGSDQLKMAAAISFAHYPKVNTITTGYVWLKENKLDKEVFIREQAATIWQSFLPRVRRLEIAYDTDNWVPRPSGLCKKWCPVGRVNCEFCGR